MSNPYELDKAEHDRRYARIEAKYIQGCEAQERPRAIIVGGQPASGKTKLTQAAGRELFKEGGFVLIDPDTLRNRHPLNNQLMRENDREAASLTHSDASKWAKRLTADAISGRRNIVFDQTCKSPEKLLERTEQLREAGYHVELRVMAVNAETSQQRIFSRYENQKANDGAGRFVPKEVHDAAYLGLAESVAAVERNKSVDAISVYDKTQQRFYSNELHNGEWAMQPPGARAALDIERNRQFSLEEHREQAAAYDRLSEMLEARQADPGEREEIESLRVKANRKLDAEIFRSLPKEAALEERPHLAAAYTAVQAMSEQVKREGLPAEQRRIEVERARYNVAAAIEQGRTPKAIERDFNILAANQVRSVETVTAQSKVDAFKDVALNYSKSEHGPRDEIIRRGAMIELNQRHQGLRDNPTSEQLQRAAMADLRDFDYLAGKPEQLSVALAMQPLMKHADYREAVLSEAPADFSETLDAARTAAIELNKRDDAQRDQTHDMEP